MPSSGTSRIQVVLVILYNNERSYINCSRRIFVLGSKSDKPYSYTCCKTQHNSQQSDYIDYNKYANDWVFDLPSIYGGSTLGSPTCTQQWDLNMPNAITGASSSKSVPSPGLVTCKWTASSGDLWDDVAVEIRASK